MTPERNAHSGWIENARLLQKQLPISKAPEDAIAGHLQIPAIVTTIRSYIQKGSELMKILGDTEQRARILPEHATVYDANMALLKISALLKEFKQAVAEFPPDAQSDEEDTDLRGGPPLSPVPIGGPRAGSSAAQAAIPPEAENDDPVVMEDEYVTMGPSDNVA